MSVIDYSFARPGGANIKAAGFTGVIRYLSTDSAKALSLSELQDLRNNGLDVALVWEDEGNAALGGLAQGTSDAINALNQANALGVPSTIPIYFAVDFEVTEAQMETVNAYLKAAMVVLGEGRVADYGSFLCVTNSICSLHWQTLAWSGGQIGSKIALYQNGATAFNNGADIDQVVTENYGQWAASVVGPTPKPNPNPAPNPSPSPMPATYTVVSGDTLSGIAAKFGTTYQALAALNNISAPYIIYPGEVIRISGSPVPPNGITYTVVEGDTLSAIGAKFGVAWESIAQLNGIVAPYTIYPGEVLRISGGNVPTPTPAPVSQYYTIISGDTLNRIAGIYGTTVAQLVNWNIAKYPNMTENFIEAGWVIRVR